MQSLVKTGPPREWIAWPRCESKGGKRLSHVHKDKLHMALVIALLISLLSLKHHVSLHNFDTTFRLKQKLYLIQLFHIREILGNIAIFRSSR